MDKLSKLILFLEKLEEKKIHYKLDKIRDSILVEINVPGQKWEVEFMLNGGIEVEIYKSNGKIHDERQLEILFRNFSE